MTKNISEWEARLNEEFFCGIPIDEMGTNQVDEKKLQDFIRSLLSNIEAEVEGMMIGEPTAPKSDIWHYETAAHNTALNDVLEIIRKAKL